MDELIPTINEIVKYGLNPNIAVAGEEKILEKNLVKIYNLYFDIEFEFDEIIFPEFDKSKPPDIVENVKSNFKDFGFYKTFLDIDDVANMQDIGLGCAIDDLSDIILCLLEVKWRIENNSLADGLWFFEFGFESHIQQHIIDLLKFMKEKHNRSN